LKHKQVLELLKEKADKNHTKLASIIHITKAFYGLKTDIVKLLELQEFVERND